MVYGTGVVALTCCSFHACVCVGVSVCVLFLFPSESCHLFLVKFMIFHCNVRAL